MVPRLPQIRRHHRLQQELGADRDRGAPPDRDVAQGAGVADVQLGARDERVDRDRGHAGVGAVEVHVAGVDRERTPEGVRAGESPSSSSILNNRSRSRNYRTYGTCTIVRTYVQRIGADVDILGQTECPKLIGPGP